MKINGKKYNFTPMELAFAIMAASGSFVLCIVLVGLGIEWLVEKFNL